LQYNINILEFNIIQIVTINNIRKTDFAGDLWCG